MGKPKRGHTEKDQAFLASKAAPASNEQVEAALEREDAEVTVEVKVPDVVACEPREDGSCCRRAAVEDLQREKVKPGNTAEHDFSINVLNDAADRCERASG